MSDAERERLACDQQIEMLGASNVSDLVREVLGLYSTTGRP